MIENERLTRLEHARFVLSQMMTAARTAPKTKGNDLVEIIALSGDDLHTLSDAMMAESQRRQRPGIARDAQCILRGQGVILIGIRPAPQGLNCGHCGYRSCADKPQQMPCPFNAIDIGIALGSACSLAADLRVDTRIMYSVGIGAQALGLLPDCALIQGIAVSISSKSPFFDRG